MIHGIGEWERSGSSWGLSKDCQRKTAIGGSEWYSRKPVQRQGWGGHGHKSGEIGSEKEWWVSSVRWLNGGTEQVHRERPDAEKGTPGCRGRQRSSAQGHCELRLTLTFSARAACSAAAPALRHLWDACFLNNLSPPLYTTWVSVQGSLLCPTEFISIWVYSVFI